jgi:hypothetical protein
MVPVYHPHSLVGIAKQVSLSSPEMRVWQARIDTEQQQLLWASLALKKTRFFSAPIRPPR